MASLDVRNLTRRPAPRFPYQKAKDAALPDWDVSLAFVGEARAQALNQSLRKKEYVPNVLSYATGKKSGEVIICLKEAERQAKTFGMSYSDFTGYLLIHGLMHLKGHPHGPTMDKLERALLARFVTRPLSNETTHRNRHRHRHAPDAGRRR